MTTVFPTEYVRARGEASLARKRLELDGHLVTEEDDDDRERQMTATVEVLTAEVHVSPARPTFP